MEKRSKGHALTKKKYIQGLAVLKARDANLAGVIARWGNPPFWIHCPGFPGIVRAILSQQVSLESATASFYRLEKRIGAVSPERFLTLDENTLRAIGFSRQKASYVTGVAHDLQGGALDLTALASMENRQARERLMQIRGIGAWTADTYLLFSLRRTDVWPSGDLALVKGIQEITGLDAPPSFEEADRLALRWKPWRAVAARIIWHHYLSERGRNTQV